MATLTNVSQQRVPSVADRLGIMPAGHRFARVRKAAVWLAIGLALAAAFVAARKHFQGEPAHYVTEAVERRDVTVTINATGKLQPTNEVQVGSELSGIVSTVEVDNNDRVVAGQILARIDPTKLQAQVKQAHASLDAAKAKVQQAEATVEEATAQLARMEQVHKESNGRVPAQQEIDSQRAGVKRARADRANAQAAVDQAVATLDATKTDLGKLVIRSPISGVVLTRVVDPGQTVVAAFQAPVLFTLAENLAQMELELDVDEADIGHVAVGQDATFGVDAYPDRTFKAKVTEVRFASETVDSVVTYKTTLRVDNSDLALRPGMTANADLVVKQAHQVVTVPSSALRMALGAPQDTSKGQRVWTLHDGKPVAVPVSIGLADGTHTEITSPTLAVGEQVIVDEASR